MGELCFDISRAEVPKGTFTHPSPCIAVRCDFKSLSKAQF